VDAHTGSGVEGKCGVCPGVGVIKTAAGATDKPYC